MKAEAVLRIPPRPWMAEETAARLWAALEEQARFVGGCVRDVLLQREEAGADIDIATPLAPQEVMQRLSAAGFRVIPTGIAHGTVTAVREGRVYEVTTLRADIRTDGRHAVVRFSRRWEEDATRRDFTMNALYMDRDGSIYDYVGGLADIEARRIRFIGDAEARIREDYLRILRFFRFHAWYGRGDADSKALEACARHAPGMRRLSRERIHAEWLKLLAAPAPAASVRLMEECGVLAVVLPRVRVRDITALDNEDGIDALARFGALLPAEEACRRTIGERLRLSNRNRRRLLASLPVIATGCRALADEARLRRLAYFHGAPAVADALAFCAAGMEGQAEQRRFLALRRDIVVFTPPLFPLSGRDALAAGAVPGPALGSALRRVEAWWAERDFTPERDACLGRLAEELATSR